MGDDYDKWRPGEDHDEHDGGESFWRPPGKPGGSTPSSRIPASPWVAPPDPPVQRKARFDNPAVRALERKEQHLREDALFDFSQPYIEAGGVDPTDAARVPAGQTPTIGTLDQADSGQDRPGMHNVVPMPVQRRAAASTAAPSPAIDAPRADSMRADRATIDATAAASRTAADGELDASKENSLGAERTTISAGAAGAAPAAGPLPPARAERAARKNAARAADYGVTPVDVGTDAAPDTAAFAQAVASFQAQHGLGVDGIVGPRTAAAVRGAAAPTAAGDDASGPDGAPETDARGAGSQLLQMKAASGAATDDDVHRAAAAGTAGSSQPLPHLDRIQASFGGHDVTGVSAHVGGAAADAAAAIGAEAYATGDHVAFRDAPDLHTAAHEAAHVVQQRAGVQLKGGVGKADDAYEQHADTVADKVVRGESAESLLDQRTSRTPASPTAGVQQTAARSPHAHRAHRYARQPIVQRKGGDDQPASPRGAGSLAPQLVMGLGDASFMLRGFPVKFSGAVTIARTTGPSSGGPIAAEWFKPQVDVLRHSLASTLFTGLAKGTLSQFPGVTVEAAGKVLSGKQSANGAVSWSMEAADLPSISFLSAGVSFKGNLPELLDGLSPDAQKALAGGRVPPGGLGSIVKVTVSGTVSVDLLTADQAAAKAAEETAQAAAKHQAAHAAKAAELKAVNAQHAAAGAERAVLEKELNALKRRPPAAPVGAGARETFEHMQATRAWNERTHQLEKQLGKAAAREAELAARMTTLGREAAEELRGYQRHLSKLKNLKNGATAALASWIAKFAETSLGKVALKAFSVVAILGGVIDVAIVLVDLLDIVANLDSLRFALLGGGPSGPGGQRDDANAAEGAKDGSGSDPTQTEGEGSGGGASRGADPRGPAGRGGAGTGGGMGDGRETAGSGADGRDSAGRGTGQEGSASHGTGERPGAGGGRDGASSGEVELSLEAKMVLAQSGVGNGALDDEARRRLNRIVASLTDRERDKLVDVLGSWRPGGGGEMLADLEKAIAGLRADASESSDATGGNQTSPGARNADQGGGARAPRKRPRPGPGQGGDERGAGGKDDKRHRLQREHVFPIGYDLIQQLLDPLLDAGQLTVSPKEAERAIVERAGELLEGTVRQGPRGPATFVDVDGATPPKNVAAAGKPPRWEFHLLLLVEVGGKQTTDYHKLSYEPTMPRGQHGYDVDFTEVAAQLVVEGSRIRLKKVGAVVSFVRWKGQLLRVKWHDQPGGKAVVTVMPLHPVPDGERLDGQDVVENVPIDIVVGE